MRSATPMVHARKAFLVLTLGAVLLVTVALSLSSTFAGNWGGRDRAPGGVLIGFAVPAPAHAPLLAENERQPSETTAPTATLSATLEANGQEAGTPVPSATLPPPPTVSPTATQAASATPTTSPTATVTSTASRRPAQPRRGLRQPPRRPAQPRPSHRRPPPRPARRPRRFQRPRRRPA